MANGSVVVVGGTEGLGRELAQAYADEGREVVVTGRDQSRAATAAKEIRPMVVAASGVAARIAGRTRVARPSPRKASATHITLTPTARRHPMSGSDFGDPFARDRIRGVEVGVLVDRDPKPIDELTAEPRREQGDQGADQSEDHGQHVR